MAAMSVDELAFKQSLHVLSLSYVFQVMATISDLLVTYYPMLEIVHTSPTELLNPEDVEEVLGILLLSSVKAWILRYIICNSGYGGHFYFFTQPDVG